MFANGSSKLCYLLKHMQVKVILPRKYLAAMLTLVFFRVLSNVEMHASDMSVQVVRSAEQFTAMRTRDVDRLVRASVVEDCSVSNEEFVRLKLYCWYLWTVFTV